jgi:hypothetical protein
MRRKIKLLLRRAGDLPGVISAISCITYCDTMYWVGAERLCRVMMVDVSMILLSDIRKKMTQNTVSEAISVGFCLLASALVWLGFLAGFSSANAEESHSEALARYYVEVASEVFHKQDIRRSDSLLEITVIVRRFTLESDLDTLQLDTAVVRLYLTPDLERLTEFFSDTGFSSELLSERQSESSPDSLRPDSAMVLRSSFLDDKPTLPGLFAKPSWQGEFSYSLFPNDPGTGDISVAYDSLAAGGGLSQTGSSGILTMDRSTGILRSATLLIRSDNNISRYSRETFYETIEGYLIPVRIVEQFSEIGFWENRYEIRETIFLNLRFTGAR